MRSLNDDKKKTVKSTPVKIKSTPVKNNNNNISTPKKGATLQMNNNSKTITLPKAQHANSGPGSALGVLPDELSGGIQDTIYLCNFRVSVDGEWLCLKELQDLDIQDNSGKNQSTSGNMLSGRTGTDIVSTSGSGNNGSSGSYINNFARDPAAIERSNLVNISKLVVKELLEQSIRFGRMLDSDHLPLQHFFIVLEHVLRHGLRSKKGLLGPKKELWDLLQSVEKICPESQDITQSVRDLPTVRTHIGRARAWLRIALMQKKLADYLQALIENREEILFEYYEPHALMMSEEVVVIMGILVGLNVIDCNLCVKEEDLDSQQGVIDFSLYLRSSSKNSPEDDVVEDELSGNMTAVLDQKNYIEELNRHLNATVGNLQAKIESLTTTNALMKEDLAIARNSVLAVTAENQALRQNLGSGNANISPACDTQSTTSDKSLRDIQEALTEEKRKNLELEKEVKIQISLKAETDMAMKLLEKDIHEKQDTIVSLRRQLDDIKGINLEMYKKLQECEIELTQKGEMVARLQAKASQIGDILQTLERKYESSGVDPDLLQDALHPLTDAEKSRVKMQQNLKKFDELSRRHKLDPPGPPSKRLHLKVDPLLPPKPITKIRKSPTVPGQSGNSIAPTTPGEDNHKISGE